MAHGWTYNVEGKQIKSAVLAVGTVIVEFVYAYDKNGLHTWATQTWWSNGEFFTQNIKDCYYNRSVLIGMKKALDPALQL